jgi:hypothetical protein
VGCADNQHCCPHDAPVCDTARGVCTSEDGAKSVPWTTKTPAQYAAGAPEPGSAAQFAAAARAEVQAARQDDDGVHADGAAAV